MLNLDAQIEAALPFWVSNETRAHPGRVGVEQGARGASVKLKC